MTLFMPYNAVQIADAALEVVFEGVRVNSKVDHFVPHFSDAAADNPRVQIRGAALVFGLVNPRDW